RCGPAALLDQTREVVGELFDVDDRDEGRRATCFVGLRRPGCRLGFGWRRLDGLRGRLGCAGNYVRGLRKRTCAVRPVVFCLRRPVGAARLALSGAPAPGWRFFVHVKTPRAARTGGPRLDILWGKAATIHPVDSR